MAKLARLLGVKEKNILFASTGIIGKKIPKEKIIAALPRLKQNLAAKTQKFSKSIMTTDTFSKIAQAKISFKEGKADILGFCKGAGMICPNMATMLAFVITDVNLPAALFRKIAKEAVEESFNSITVDGCMSTNDTIFFLSSAKVDICGKKEMDIFSKKLKEVCLNLAQMIARDGEGASKFIEILVKNARSEGEAKKGALYIANSNLVKTAIHGANPNWGRVVAALGQAGIKLNEGKYNIFMSNLGKKEVKITVDLKSGKCDRTIYTSDLTPEYIKINAEYS
jgi:glutamate N-acetyltransferase/amino-acid N-acetyltransferase